MSSEREAPLTVRLRLLSEARARRVLSGRRSRGDRWAPGYPSDGDREASAALLREIDRKEFPGAFGPYEILDSTTKTVLGGIGFHSQPDDLGSVEIGYGVVDSEANKGYATAALAALLEIAARQGVRKVVGRALPTNRASCRVMEKAGLTFEGIAGGYACYGIELGEERPPAGEHRRP